MTPPVTDRSAAAVILAAGRGTRMGSDKPKVLQQLNGRPMIAYLLETLQLLGFGSERTRKPLLVVGHRADLVMAFAGDSADYALQKEQLGTGHAAAVGLDSLPPAVRRVLLIHGDEPLIGLDTFRELLECQVATGAAIVLLTGDVRDTHGLGRVIRDGSGRIVALVEEKELTVEQRRVHEINFGAYVFDRTFLESCLPLEKRHEGGEYYLTDVVHVARERGLHIESVGVPYPDEQMGVNDPLQLRRAERFIQRMAS